MLQTGGVVGQCLMEMTGEAQGVAMEGAECQALLRPLAHLRSNGWAEGARPQQIQLRCLQEHLAKHQKGVDCLRVLQK